MRLLDLPKRTRDGRRGENNLRLVENAEEEGQDDRDIYGYGMCHWIGSGDQVDQKWI